MASSGSSSTSSGTFALGPCGRITSQGICGWPGQGLSANVLTPLPPENGWDPSARPGVPRRQVCPNSEGVASFVHLAPLAHTWLLRSLFWEDSVVSGGVLRGAGAGVAGWWERVLCWDEALYPRIFLWEWESVMEEDHLRLGCPDSPGKPGVKRCHETRGNGESIPPLQQPRLSS